ncbi:glycine receptor subunit alphaZ1-like isoform X2 [Petromyzon marinus]|uniref:glycine receptor subunit alphaZ1-like isoform X2 n=1 Tax=Petromyzon marinus TaxID=7757 RepID=UPI003F6E65EE
MYIQNYPWDIQFCPMTLTSASYTANEMFLQWDKDERRMIAKDISILPLVVENITLSDNCTYTEIIGNLSCLNITFKLCRRMSASDIQMYVSSGLLSGLSCIAFLIPVDKTPARAGIGITTTISVITQCANAHANMPKVSYMTAMDIWMTGCLSFIVCTFIVNILETSFCHNKKDNSAQTEGVGQTQADEEDPSHSGSAAAQDDDENRGGEPPIASSCDRLGAAVGCLKKVLRAIFCKHKLFVLSLFIFSTLIIIYFVLNNKC